MSDARGIKSDLDAFYQANAAARAVSELRPNRSLARARFLEVATGERRRHVLDLGAGTGQDAAALVASGLEVTAVDLSLEHARWCSRRGASAVVADFYRLPLRDGAISAAWSASALVHVPNADIGGVLAEVHRVMAREAPIMVGIWTGTPGETVRSEGGLRRFYSIRSVAVTLRLLSAHFTVEDWWTDPTEDPADDDYLWCLVRA